MREDEKPPVEDILASIRQVMERDNRHIVAHSRQRRIAAEEAAHADAGMGIEAGERPEPVDPDEAEEVLDLSQLELPPEDGPGDDRTARASDAADRGDAAAPVDAGQEDAFDEPPLTAPTTRGALKENLAALAMLSEPGARPQVVRSGETSLEGLTRELLRPMLAEWLDQNLPAMVEKMVQAEIARIVGKSG
ncbi:MAG: DUF2497 domain-containing protein [Erythrobacter sp.]